MKFYKITILIFTALFFTNCEQKITIKKHKLTSINPVAYTCVVYKSNRDTVFVSTYSGKIYELINNKENRKQIASLDDEIYSLVYNTQSNELYGATLNSGVVIINASTGAVTGTLPIQPGLCIRIIERWTGIFYLGKNSIHPWSSFCW